MARIKSKSEISEAKQEAKKEAKVVSDNLIAALAASSRQNREYRLKNLARTNRDVAWLLAEYQKLSTHQNKPKNNSK